MYTGSIFLQDLFNLLNLQKTSDNYKNLGVRCDRNLFYYPMQRKLKYLNDNVIIALNVLLNEELKDENKKNKFLKYLKEYLPEIKLNNRLELIIIEVLSKFSYPNNKKDNNEIKKEIEELYIKSAKYLRKDKTIAISLIQSTISRILDNFYINENIPTNTPLKALTYKKIPENIISCINHTRKLLTHNNYNTDMIFENLNWIVKWYFSDYYSMNFDNLKLKAESNYNKESILKVCSLNDLMHQGYTVGRLAKMTYELYTATINNLASDNTSTVQELVEIISTQSETRRILMENETPIGCWSLNPMFEEDFQRDKAGTFYVSEFNAETIPIIMRGGIYNIHFGAICLLEKYRKSTVFNKLFFSIIEFIEELAINNIYINEICTQAYSSSGVALAKTMGLKSLGVHEDGKGKIYHGNIKELLNQPFLRDFKVLKSMYKTNL